MKNGCDIHLRFVGRIFTGLHRLVRDNYFYFENGGKKNP